jgi:plasmid stabilization system protein ParE
MMPFPYRIHELAYKEYIEAYEWYEAKKDGLGGRFMNAVENRVKQITEHPEYYSKKHGNFRQAKVEDFPYMIVFEFFKHNQLIHISSVYHNKRNPKGKYRRMK